MDLGLSYDPKAHRDYNPVELVRFALGASDHWADLAIGFLEQGVSVLGLEMELQAVESQTHRPQRLRHRARRLRKAAQETP